MSSHYSPAGDFTVPRASSPAGWLKTLLCALLSVLLGVPAQAAAAGARTFADLSIEELMNESVTSVSKRETRLADSPAAISVVTSDDIRRFGFTSLADALRLVPGMDVARINSTQWAISARGFNDQYAHKLLVLMDGRSVYTPAFGGVFWNAQDMVLEDLDRIEAIRGPGATLWGANAINGVVNITSKSALNTQGLLVTTTAGTEDRASAAIRYGGALADDLHYRVYLKYFDRNGSLTSAGAEGPDTWDAIRTGFRADWQPTPQDLVTVQGDFYLQEAGNRVTAPSFAAPFSRTLETHDVNRGFNLLGRWTRTFSNASQFSLQAYYDRFRNSQALTVERRDTADIEFQYRHPLSARHDLTAGAGYRFSRDSFNATETLVWNPLRADVHLFTAFVQDEIAIAPERFSISLGSKFEHNSFTGVEVQPGVRLLWTPATHQTFWAAASRAVSTPSRFILGADVTIGTFQPDPFAPIFAVKIVPNVDASSETQDGFELGYRLEPAANLSFDIATFYNRYKHLNTIVAGAPRFETQPAPPHMLIPLEWQDSAAGDTYGAELSAQWKPVPRWHLTASYSRLEMRLPGSDSTPKANPRHQASLRSHLSLPRNLELSTAAYYVSAIGAPINGGVIAAIPAYVRLDVGLLWHPTPRIELGVWGQNLLDPQHPEFGDHNSSLLLEQRRNFAGRITWRF